MNPYFVEALDLQKHPIKKAKKITRAKYFSALSYLVEKTVSEGNDRQTVAKPYVTGRLRLYRKQLFSDLPIEAASEGDGPRSLAGFSRAWKSKYLYMLACDAALILLDDTWVSQAVKTVKERLSAKRQADLDQVVALLYNDREMEEKYFPASLLIKQFRANKAFLSKPERRIIVTANMSAGKSTLINALVGKPVARTSQEACTGNVCYLFNKAYEDGNVPLLTQELHLCATAKDLRGYDWNGPISIASYFAAIDPDIPRLCMIDTPGVDAALYREHSQRAHDALQKGDFDTVLYVVSPTRLGTDAEKKHLQWVARHVSTHKIVFILNKLDDYHDSSDSIEESVRYFKEDLLNIGFENPIVCPISAYCSYLIKMRMCGQELPENEKEDYAFFAKKFMKPAYDLSHFYEGVECLPSDSEEIALSKRVGLYGLEKIIYGGGL